MPACLLEEKLLAGSWRINQAQISSEGREFKSGRIFQMVPFGKLVTSFGRMPAGQLKKSRFGEKPLKVLMKIPWELPTPGTPTCVWWFNDLTKSLLWFLGCPVQEQELDSVILLDPPQLWIFYNSRRRSSHLAVYLFPPLSLPIQLERLGIVLLF